MESIPETHVLAIASHVRTKAGPLYHAYTLTNIAVKVAYG